MEGHCGKFAPSILYLSLGIAALPVMSRNAAAQVYPLQPVRIVVGFAAGGPTDIAARVIGQWLSERLGQPFIAENRPGAASNIATEAVVRAPADGHTLLLAGIPNAINETLHEKLNFNFIRDIAPVARVTRDFLILVAHPSVPAKTIPDLIAYAKDNPGKINMASGGIGAPAHLAGELFNMMTGVSIVHVPYRGGGPAIAALLGGQVQVYFASVATSVEHIRAGKLRALGVTASSRSDLLPEIPTIQDFVPDFQVAGWFGMGAPKDTPKEIIAKLNVEINAGLADAKVKGRLADLGLEVLAGSPTDFGKLISDETERWGRVIRAAGIKAQ